MKNKTLTHIDQNLNQENNRLIFAVIGAVVGVLAAHFNSDLNLIWWQKILPNTTIDSFFPAALVFAVVLALIGYFSAGFLFKRKTKIKNEKNIDLNQESSFNEEENETHLKYEKNLAQKKAWEKEDRPEEKENKFEKEKLIKMEQEYSFTQQVPADQADQMNLIESAITRVKEEILKELAQARWTQSEENTKMRFLFQFLSDSIKKLESIDICCKDIPENMAKVRTGVVMLMHNINNENLKPDITEDMNKVTKVLDYIDNTCETVLNETLSLVNKINLLVNCSIPKNKELQESTTPT